MRDLIDELQRVTRVVGADTLPAGEANVVTLTRTYAAEVEDVWDAIVDPERLQRWFLPVSGDLRLGGTYQLEGNAGGEIRRCDPPRHLRLTWIMGPAPEQDASLVDVRLEPAPDGEGTRLELRHVAVPPPGFWDTYGPGAVGVGWDLALVGLAMHVAGLEVGSPEQMDRDPAVRAAMAASSEAWGEAARASGEDAQAVAARVAATTAFYVPPQEG